MKSKLRLILLVGLLYLVFLLVTFPAAQAYVFIKSAAGKELPLQVSGLSGTIWSGQARSVVLSGQLIKTLSWNLHPLAILFGRLEANIDFRDGDTFGRGNVGKSLLSEKIYLSDFEANLAMEKIIAIAKFPLDMKGSLGLNLNEFQISNGLLVEADGTIALQDAKTLFPMKMTLGNLKLDLKTENQLVIGTLVDGGGALQVDGLLTLGPDDKFKFTGNFAARDNSDPILSRNLKLLGKPGRDGKIKVNKSGSVTKFTKLLSSSK